MCRNVINDETSIVYCDNMDVVGRIARDLECEGVELSNDKIVKILSALRTLAQTFYRVYVKTVEQEGQTMLPQQIV